MPDPTGISQRRRDPLWREAIIQAWDRQCAFCGFDGQILGATVGIDAAHVRWFALDGLDEPDNGLALCALHHKLFDRGALGLDRNLRILVSATYTARTAAGRALYSLHGSSVQARPPRHDHQPNSIWTDTAAGCSKDSPWPHDTPCVNLRQRAVRFVRVG